MYNPNLMYVMNQQIPDEPAVNETFFCNQLIKDNNINESNQNARFLVNGKYHFQIVPDTKGKFNARPAGWGASSQRASRIWCTPKFSIAEAKITGEVMQLRKSSWSCTAPSAARSSTSSAAVSHASPSRSAAAVGS